jgi:hypothetical protein
LKPDELPARKKARSLLSASLISNASETVEGFKTRKVDAKGRVYLSRGLKGSELYMVEVDGVILLSPSRERILSVVEKLSARSALREYLALLEELGEPAPKEVEELARSRTWKSVEG